MAAELSNRMESGGLVLFDLVFSVVDVLFEVVVLALGDVYLDHCPGSLSSMEEGKAPESPGGMIMTASASGAVIHDWPGMRTWR